MNFLSCALCCRAAVTAMAGSGGRIVNISARAGLEWRSGAGMVAYTTSKAAVAALTVALAEEVAKDGILVNALCPGYVDTEMTTKNNSPAELEKIKSAIPLRRLAPSAELARVAGFLCSEENSYLTGQAVVADGGFTCQ